METRSVILSPAQYTQASTYDLLCAAGQGFAGIDHRLLHAIVDDPEKAIPDLLRFGMENRQHRVESFDEHLVQMFRRFRTPRAIPFLIEFFRRSHLEMNIPLICALQEIGEPAVEPLLEVYRAAGFEQDSDAGFLLAGLGVRDPRILDVLIERLKFDAIDAGHCLAAYGDAAAVPAMRAAIEQAEEEWVARSLEFCLEELEQGSAPRADEPFDLWEMYPEKAWPRFDLLTPEETEMFLDSSDADYRLAALEALYEEKIPPRLWDRLLQVAREDPDARVRGKCWQSLIDAWERPDIQKAMRACLADETASGEERIGALLSLAGGEGDKRDIQRRILEFYALPEFRARALEAMINTQDPAFGQYFRQHLGDPDRDTCVKAMLGIGLMEMESDASRLVPYFKDEELRLDALPAYTLCAACEPSRAGFRRLYKKIEKLAGDLSVEEEDAVKEALNTRAYRNDLEPVFGDQGEMIEDEPVIAAPKVGRNDPCPCGSGKKYKKCCGG